MTNLFDPMSSFYFWKGRVALYSILKAIGVGSGDEVVVPGYTCVVVPNAVLYTGAIPVYADIDSDTYNVTRQSIQSVISEKTAAIVCQSTYGLSPDLDGILEIANAHDLPVIDDCTHGLGGFYKGKPNGFVTDAAFFSAQWSKPVSAGLGGIAVVSDKNLSRKVKGEYDKCLKASLFDDWILAAQRVIRPVADLPWLHYTAVKAYRWATQTAGLSVGSSSAEEIAGTTKPPGFEKKCGPMQKSAIVRQIKSLEKKIEDRHKSAKLYDEYFKGMSKIETPSTPEYAVHGMLRYTVQVDHAAELRRIAKIENIPVGDWFDTPIYPIYENLDRWLYQEGSCPVAEMVCKRVINLPTDKPLSLNSLNKLFTHHS